jgi:adenine-specific DNA-methyltransferase
MSTKKNKLELTWIGKDQRPRLEPRILLEDPTLSHHAPHKVTENDLFDNRLIFGDNLLALKALEQEFAGKVKCVFIDPPYNTGSAFTHYDDGLEHSIWLGLMRDRLELIKRLLSDDGSLWITIDDNEVHYLKVMCDEIFGRQNFATNVLWQKIHSIKNDARLISVNHDLILIYAKNINNLSFNLLPRTETMNARFTNPDNDPRGVWSSGDLVASEARVNGNYIVKGPTGKEFTVAADKHWVYSQENLEQMIKENRIWFGANGTAFPRKKRFLSEVQQGRKADTWWKSDEVGHNQEAKREVKQFNEHDIFSTPKPERLLERILTLATNTGDLVLDSFAGSGTTGAVAHKMGRRWIMIELGEHCHTHIIPRLQKVLDGTDQGGISKAVNWQGGGGFRYYKLAGSLLEKDHWGNWVISKQYNPAMLTEALCKLEGFTYAPSESVYWQQGYSTETDYIYVTTQTLSTEQLQALSDEVGTERSLLVLCSAFKGNAERFSNLTIKKIPRAVLAKCEWGHDDYSLNVENLPMAEKPPENVVTRSARQSPKSPEQLSLLPETSEGA